MSLTLSRITIATYSIVPKNVFPDSVQSLEQENNIKLSRSNINQIIIASPIKTKLVLDSAHRSKVLPEGG